MPNIFISYAWEKWNNKFLQKRLKKLRCDLKQLDFSNQTQEESQVFLDIIPITGMRGNMRQTMQNEMAASDVVFLICTARMKQRVEEYNLYKLSGAYYPECLIPLSRKETSIILAPQGDNFSIYIRPHGKHIVKKSTDNISVPMAINNDHWMPLYGMKKAKISSDSNQVIEQQLGRQVHSVIFELGMALDAARTNQKTLMPLLYSGDHSNACPQDPKITEELTPDCRNKWAYYQSMGATIIPSIFPALSEQGSQRQKYKTLFQEFEAGLKKGILDDLKDSVNNFRTFFFTKYRSETQSPIEGMQDPLLAQPLVKEMQDPLLMSREESRLRPAA